MNVFAGEQHAAFEDLESRIMFLESLVDKLNGALTAQQHELLEQKRSLQILSERMALLRETPLVVSDEKPPHY